MPSLPEMIIAVLIPFAGLFSPSVWSHAQGLVVGAFQTQGPRTVAAILRVMGLGQEPRFERSHAGIESGARVGLAGREDRIGAGASVAPSALGAGVGGGWDDTVERRQGKRIQAKRGHPEAVRPTVHHRVGTQG
jgi:hypothetical protein